MLWTMMSFAGLIACVTSAVVAARGANLGIEGHSLLIGIATLVGIANVWAMNRVGDTFIRWTKRRSEQVRERYARLLYLTAFVWIFVPPFLIVAAANQLLASRR